VERGERAKRKLGGPSPGEKFFGGTKRNKVEQLNWRDFFEGGDGNCLNGGEFSVFLNAKTAKNAKGQGRGVVVCSCT
jgi:hypothetical protein